jgi:phospholipase/lecithinase/hemolysin
MIVSWGLCLFLCAIPPSVIAAGFTETRKACCGSGYLEAGILCNEATPGTCTDANPFLFWDGFHPTTHFYKILADDILNGGRYPFVP